MSRRKVWIHRCLAGFFAALTLPAVLWWAEAAGTNWEARITLQRI